MSSLHLAIGSILKGKSYNYKIEGVLGQGSFGITYLASVKMTGALGAIDANVNVAIKEFFMRDINGRSDATVTSGSNGGIFDDYKKKFIREALNLSKLQHPNIIKVIESFEANNTVYFTMEYISGGSLDDYIVKNKVLKESEAIKIVKQIGSALTYMHSQGMLHLDLKPGNIMMKNTGEAILIDFGLSKQYDEGGEPESSTKVGAGTPGYAPIEQANYREGKDFPVTMDVYALGATLFKMLTGRRPPEASEILNDEFPADELQAHSIHDDLIASISKAMAAKRKDRYQSVIDFLSSLNSYDSIVLPLPPNESNDRTELSTKIVKGPKLLGNGKLVMPDALSIHVKYGAKGYTFTFDILSDHMHVIVTANPLKIYGKGSVIDEEYIIDFHGFKKRFEKLGFLENRHWEKSNSGTLTGKETSVCVNYAWTYKNFNINKDFSFSRTEKSNGEGPLILAVEKLLEPEDVLQRVIEITKLNVAKEIQSKKIPRKTYEAKTVFNVENDKSPNQSNHLSEEQLSVGEKKWKYIGPIVIFVVYAFGFTLILILPFIYCGIIVKCIIICVIVMAICGIIKSYRKGND